MKVVTLIYHDVVDAARADESGRRGAGPALYKLEPAQFAAHLSALDGVAPAARLDWAAAIATPGVAPVLLTFDDGGVSAARHIAPELERRGWRGHFFVTTDEIGKPGYLGPPEIRALAASGHTVGSHSASHPDLFAMLDPAEQAREWRRSLAVLSDILGSPVRTGSVPGGLFDATVSRVAAECGLAALFTSEPRVDVIVDGGCHVFGRYSIMRRTSAREVAEIVGDRNGRRRRAAVSWAAKRALRSFGGEPYLRLRRYLLDLARPDGRPRR